MATKQERYPSEVVLENMVVAQTLKSMGWVRMLAALIREITSSLWNIIVVL